MAKAKKLPSGSWRCLVYDYTDENGKRIYKSFTSQAPSPKGKREAEKTAAEYAATKEIRNRLPILLTAFGSMRRGEISDLHTENINGDTVHV